MSSLLERLTLTPAEYAALPSDACERILDFLLHWQDYASACLSGQPAHARCGPGRRARRRPARPGPHAGGDQPARSAHPHTQQPAGSEPTGAPAPCCRRYEAAVAAARQLPWRTRRAGAGRCPGAGCRHWAASKPSSSNCTRTRLGSRQPRGADGAETAAAAIWSPPAPTPCASSNSPAAAPELSVDELLALRAGLGASGDTLRGRPQPAPQRPCSCAPGRRQGHDRQRPPACAPRPPPVCG